MSFPDKCGICPRRCFADRRTSSGYCRSPADITVNLVSRHLWEEPCVSGTRGSGTVFFSGCSLGCIYCQNSKISREPIGDRLGVGEFADLLMKTAESGVHNINLVTPTHYTPLVCEALALVKDRLGVPVVWNGSGYELPETLEMTRGLVDIYLPDFKYSDPALAGACSGAPDYPDVAREAVAAMLGLCPRCEFDDRGMMLRGVMVRHLCLPGYRANSQGVLDILDKLRSLGDIRLSLMSQYTPLFYSGSDRKLSRRLTTFEYDKVCRHALELGFEGFFQKRESATDACTPNFGDRL
ncbi:MAG: radical SAM protein, partial [Clostridia bacterium]|nr:radical SAM protein [Clostridia bacterium]